MENDTSTSGMGEGGVKFVKELWENNLKGFSKKLISKDLSDTKKENYGKQ